MVRARRAWTGVPVAAGVLAASVRAAARPKKRSGYRRTWPWRAFNATAQWLDRRVGWHRLPTPLGMAALVGLRNILRQQNLHDTTSQPAVNEPPLPPFATRMLGARTPDGAYNDLDQPRMGMAGSRFGRNVPIEHTAPEPEPQLLSPNPRVVSRELLTRDEFQPATTLNVLAAAWIQFMVKDWFSHGRGDIGHPWELPLAEDDPWPERPMVVPRTVVDPTRPPDADTPPTYLNAETHWWDASHVYGSSPELQRLVRSGTDGKLVIGEDGVLPVPDDPRFDPGRVPGWWVGLAMMVSVFALEHNAISDRLRADHPHWSDEDLFQRARLVNAALIAKIHTVEWTPAVISHPTTVAGMRANWFGVAGERVRRLLGRISANEVVSGIPGSETDHFGVPYALTEEFTAVYRMHPLIRDDYSLRSVVDDSPLETLSLRETTGPHAQEVLGRVSLTDLFYSFGTLNPGAIVLHNYPRLLQEFERPDGHLQDLAAIDVLRMRELGVPRYNQFRRLLHLRPARTFDDLTDNPRWAEEMRRVYDGDIERLDLMIGMFAERLPPGFAFSDTAFRIFILMASRRLNSDRFFTRHFTPQVYTPAGFEWVNANSFTTVLLRHFPSLVGPLGEIANAFAPWAPSRP